MFDIKQQRMKNAGRRKVLDPAMLPFRQRLANFEKFQSGVAKPISQYAKHNIKNYIVVSQNKQPVLERRKQFATYKNPMWLTLQKPKFSLIHKTQNS